MLSLIVCLHWACAMHLPPCFAPKRKCKTHYPQIKCEQALVKNFKQFIQQPVRHRRMPHCSRMHVIPVVIHASHPPCR